MTHRTPRPARLRGSTLIVSLVMLALLSVLAVVSLQIGRSSLLVAGNAQAQAVTQSAAQQIINQVISNKTFADAPNNVLDNSNCPASFNAPANSRCVDVNGNDPANPGKTVIQVALSPAPRCLQMRPIPSSELDLSNAEDLGCTAGLNNQNSGIAGASGLSSLCASTLWEITAAASDPVTGAQSTVVQGVSLRVSTDSAASACP